MDRSVLIPMTLVTHNIGFQGHCILTSVRSGGLGCGGKIEVYFQNSSECSCGFWLVCSYILTSDIGNVRSSGSQTFLINSWHGNLNFRRFIYFLSGFCFRSEFYFQNNIYSTISRERDLVTMVEVGSTRLTSLERVIMGVRSVSRAARAKPNSNGRSLWPTLPHAADSMGFSWTRYLLDLELTQMATEVGG